MLLKQWMHCLLVHLKVTFKVFGQFYVLSGQLKSLILNSILFLAHFDIMTACHCEVLAVLLVSFQALQLCQRNRRQTIDSEVF